MLNMNSPVVQNLMQSGFNPYMNNGYVPQQPQQNIYGGYPQQNIYSGYPQPQQNIYSNNYNPYVANQTIVDEIENWNYCYDPMPNVIINEARGIHSRKVYGNQNQTNYNGYYGNMQNNNPYFNQAMFNGYMNPILMRNQEEANRLKQREEAIEQGKIWRMLLQSDAKNNEDFDLEGAVHYIESLYYQEPIVDEIPLKDRIIIEKNNHFGELETRLEYFRENNIPIQDSRFMMRESICNYYNHINDIIGDPENCDMVDYFTRVYPELKYEQMSYEAERYRKNLKNKYNSKDFDKMINKTSADKPDSYYYKLLQNYADNGVRIETSSGLVVTPDQMEVKLPEKFRDKYQQQRLKFFNSVFNKGEGS